MEDPLKSLRVNLDQIVGLSSTYQRAIAQLSTSATTIAAFQDPMKRWFDQQQKLYGTTAAILSNARLISEMTSVSRNLSVANVSLSSLLDTASVSNDSLSMAFSDSYAVSRSLAKLAERSGISALLSHADMARVFQTSLQSQVQLEKLQSSVFGSRISASVKLSNDLASSLGVFTASYRDLIENLPQITESQIPFVANYATVEYSQELSVLEQLSVEDPEPVEYHAVSVIDDEIMSSNGDLIQLIEGARHSLDSSNPDKTRHVTTSVREMMTQILHRLAPDEDIRKWTKDPSHFANGRPTRRARLMYICRQFSSDPLDKFIELDLSAVIQLFEIVNGGTHGVTSKLTDQQLHAIVCRAESLAFFMLRASKGY